MWFLWSSMTYGFVKPKDLNIALSAWQCDRSDHNLQATTHISNKTCILHRYEVKASLKNACHGRTLANYLEKYCTFHSVLVLKSNTSTSDFSHHRQERSTSNAHFLYEIKNQNWNENEKFPLNLDVFSWFEEWVCFNTVFIKFLLYS